MKCDPVNGVKFASEAPFPYGWPGQSGICYFTLNGFGIPTQLRYRDEMRTYLATDQPRGLYAVWPGQYRSDLFFIDDLDALRAAVGEARA